MGQSHPLRRRCAARWIDPGLGGHPGTFRRWKAAAEYVDPTKDTSGVEWTHPGVAIQPERWAEYRCCWISVGCSNNTVVCCGATVVTAASCVAKTRAGLEEARAVGSILFCSLFKRWAWQELKWSVSSFFLGNFSPHPSQLKGSSPEWIRSVRVPSNCPSC